MPKVNIVKSLVRILGTLPNVMVTGQSLMSCLVKAANQGLRMECGIMFRPPEAIIPLTFRKDNKDIHSPTLAHIE